MPRDLGPDVSHRVDVDSRSLVPDGPAPTGHRLTVTGQEPFQFAWRQPEEKQVREGNGDPNGNVTAPKGTLYVERDAPSLWQNSDGLTAWTEVGSEFASTNYWDLVAGTQLQPDAATLVTMDNLRVALGSGNRTLFEVFDDGGTATDQFVQLDTPGDFNSSIGQDYTQHADRDFSIGADRFMSIRGDEGSFIFFPIFQQSSEPADAALGASELAIWLDDTIGSPVINWKAKDAAGTVFTGTGPVLS